MILLRMDNATSLDLQLPGAAPRAGAARVRSRPLAAACSLLAACAQLPPASPPAPPRAPIPASPAPAAPAPSAEPAAGAAETVPPRTKPAYTVLFASDSDRIRNISLPAIEAVAREFRANPDRWIVLEGHSDELGSREYNVALAERRAQRVREKLASLGVPERRMRVVSYGEESYHRGNGRRVDIHYVGDD